MKAFDQIVFSLHRKGFRERVEKIISNLIWY